VKRPYTPDAGDLVWIDFDPQAGREQARRRPALVLSPLRYNRVAGLALMCPVTSGRKGYPFEVAVPEGLPISGVILADHLKSLDWQARRAERAGRAGDAVLSEVRAKIAPLIGL
jgi:mRNA interferase MazF